MKSTWEGGISAAVAETLPVSLHRWRECLLALTQRLKAMPGMAGVAGESLTPLADYWHAEAAASYNRGGVKPPADMTPAQVRATFRRAWVNAKHQVGNRPVDLAAAAARAVVVAADAEAGHAQAEYAVLARLCVELQDRAGPGGSFGLSGRLAAQLAGVSHRTAANYLKRLVATGRLVVYRRGTRASGLGTEYRIAAGTPAASVEQAPPLAREVGRAA